MPGVIINANTIIGEGVNLNTAVTVDHDNTIKDYVHISPRCHLAGNVSIGSNIIIGASSLGLII